MNGLSNYDVLWLIARRHHQDLLNEASEYRRARQGLPARKIRYPLGSQVRWLVGRALVSTGYWLLSRPASRSR